MRLKVLWIGDAVVSSGFARCTHRTLDTLSKHWDVTVLGINYDGSPHGYPYPIYPTRRLWEGMGTESLMGYYRIPELVTSIGPDAIVVQHDPWYFPDYIKVCGNVPVIGSVPVDGKNCRGLGLNGLTLAIFWTQFGLEEARRGGYTGPATVIPLGVDVDRYQPRDRKEALARLQFPEWVGESFIVGNVNRNQPRKRMDLTISYFCEWVKEYDAPDAKLFLHVAPTGDQGYDVGQLMRYYGLANRLILGTVTNGAGRREDEMPDTYAAFDLQMSTTQGEGWGLTTMEGMACGVPQIVPDWAALGEWCEDAAYKVPCTSIACTTSDINVVGGIPDKAAFVEGLERLYRDGDLRRGLAMKGLELISRREYRWPNIGERFKAEIENALYPSKSRARSSAPAPTDTAVGIEAR